MWFKCRTHLHIFTGWNTYFKWTWSNSAQKCIEILKFPTPTHTRVRTQMICAKVLDTFTCTYLRIMKMSIIHNFDCAQTWLHHQHSSSSSSSSISFVRPYLLHVPNLVSHRNCWADFLFIQFILFFFFILFMFVVFVFSSCIDKRKVGAQWKRCGLSSLGWMAGWMGSRKDLFLQEWKWIDRLNNSPLVTIRWL